jgi:hypothetical protein
MKQVIPPKPKAKISDTTNICTQELSPTKETIIVISSLALLCLLWLSVGYLISI